VSLSISRYPHLLFSLRFSNNDVKSLTYPPGDSYMYIYINIFQRSDTRKPSGGNRDYTSRLFINNNNNNNRYTSSGRRIWPLATDLRQSGTKKARSNTHGSPSFIVRVANTLSERTIRKIERTPTENHDVRFPFPPYTHLVLFAWSPGQPFFTTARTGRRENFGRICSRSLPFWRVP